MAYIFDWSRFTRSEFHTGSDTRRPKDDTPSKRLAYTFSTRLRKKWSLTKRWSQDERLSQILLTQALRQASVWLSFDVRHNTMTETRILLGLLGLLYLLIPIGKCAEYLIALRKGLDFSFDPMWLANGVSSLGFGVLFLFSGMRLANLLQNRSRLPNRLVDAYLAVSAILALINYIAGDGVNAFGLLLVAAIHWYFSRRIKTLSEEYEVEPEEQNTDTASRRT